jgi:hypothetical protein
MKFRGVLVGRKKETSRKSLREFFKEPDVDNMPEFER